MRKSNIVIIFKKVTNFIVREKSQLNLAKGKATISAQQNNDGYIEKGLFKNHVITHSQDVTYTSRFQGRENEIEKMINKVNGNGNGHILISGIGGIGKTTIAKYFYNYCRKNFTDRYIGFFAYKDNLDDSIMNALDFKVTGNKQQDVKQAWKIVEDFANSEDTIFIIDNFPVANNKELEKLYNLPKTVIITSRQREYNKFESIYIDFLPIEVCKSLFINIAKLENGTYEDEKLNEFITSVLGKHTLTVELIAKILKYKQWTLDCMIKKLKINNFKIKYRENSETTNIQQEYDKIYSISGLGDIEVKILGAFALFNSMPIKSDICLSWLRDDIKIDNKEIFFSLYNIGWLSKSTDGYFLHPVFSEFLLCKIAPKLEAYPNLYDKFYEMMKCRDDQKKIEYHQYYPHIFNFAKKIQYKNKTEKDKIEKLFLEISSCLIEDGNYSEAKLWAEKVSEKESDNYVHKNILLGDVYSKLSHKSDAQKCYECVQKCICNKSIDKFIFKYKIQYAEFLYRFAENVEKKNEVINELKKMLELDEFRSNADQKGNALNCIGGFYTDLRSHYDEGGYTDLRSQDYDNALKYLIKALKIRRRYKDSHIMDLARTYNNIANVFYYKGTKGNMNTKDKKEILHRAKKYYDKSLDLRRKIISDKHPDYVRVMGNMANVLFELGEKKEAIASFEKVLNTRINVLGKFSKEVGLTYINTANLLSKYKRNKEEALKYSKEAVEIYIHVLGENSDETKKIIKTANEIKKRVSGNFITFIWRKIFKH